MSDVVSTGRRAPSVVGRTLFDYADDLAVDVPASCERTGRCRECVVSVTAGGDALSEVSAPEAFLVHPFRLACQARIERDDVPIEFESVRRSLRILVSDEEAERELDPVVTVSDGVVRYGDEPLEPARARGLGLAVDLGTTTIAFELDDLVTGRRVAVGALENPQRFGGSDVVTRIAYDRLHPGVLRQAVRRAINRELRRVYAETGVDRREVYEVVVVGNTTMRDLFFGLDIAPIGHSPFQSVTETALRDGTAPTTALTRLAHEIGLLVHPRARVVGGPLIASHVGADAAADIVAADLLEMREPFLLVDIGTNSEVVAGTGDGRFAVASSPAGPAFEGGYVAHGMAASEGAIESVAIEAGRFSWRTVGDLPAVGICGSGLVDLLAVLLRSGRLSPRGRFRDGDDAVTLVADPRVALSRRDVSHLAQAKSANLVGQQILLRSLGLRPDEVAHAYLAGGFANHIDVRHAIEIGLLVPVPEERVRRIGNASLRGAARLLLSKRLRDRLDEVVQGAAHVRLESEPDFFDLYVEGLTLGPAQAAHD